MWLAVYQAYHQCESMSGVRCIPHEALGNRITVAPEAEMLTWKHILGLMVSGAVVCLLMLLALYRRHGHLSWPAILGVGLGFGLSCFFLLIAAKRNAPVKDKESLEQ